MSQPPSYAPTSTTSFTHNTNYHEEITRSSLTPTNVHKSVYDSLAEVYSILSVLEMIEKSYIKDYITDKEKYTSTSLRLISQYQIIINGYKDDQSKISICNETFPGLNGDFSQFLRYFTEKFNLSCPLATKRLSSGVPVTIEQAGFEANSRDVSPGAGQSNANQNSRLIAEATSNFITCMDALKLNYNTKEQLHPLLSELVININHLSEENSRFDFQGKSKLITWLIKLNNLQEALNEQEIEDFLGDLNTAYKNFYLALE